MSNPSTPVPGPVVSGPITTPGKPPKVTASAAAQQTTVVKQAMARPSIKLPEGRGVVTLTPKVQTAVYEALAEGVPRRIAAQAAGISDSTLRRWLERASTGEEPFVTFAEGMAQAEAMGQITLLKQLKEHGSKAQQWTALAWILERTKPEEFGKRTEVVKTTETRQMVVEVPAQMAADEWAAKFGNVSK